MNARTPDVFELPELPESTEPTLEALLDELPIPAREPAGASPSCVLGECVDDRHPSLLGRVRVRWREPEGALVERWLATLQGLPVRTGDRVLMLRPANADEAIVTGVVDGFAKRPELARRAAGTVELRRDEAIDILASDGRPLIRVREGESGPVIELIHADLELATPGRLRLRGEAVELSATQGQIEIAASDDVVVRGEVIRLN
jgi:hypothetical protein